MRILGVVALQVRYVAAEGVPETGALLLPLNFVHFGAEVPSPTSKLHLLPAGGALNRCAPSPARSPGYGMLAFV